MLDLGEVEGGQQGGVPVNEEAGGRGEVDGASTAMRQGCYTAVRVHRGIPDLDDEQHVGGSRVSGPVAVGASSVVGPDRFRFPGRGRTAGPFTAPKCWQ